MIGSIFTEFNKQLINPERFEDTNPTSEDEEADLDQDIIFQSGLLSSGGSFSSESPNDNKENKTEEGITESKKSIAQYVKFNLYLTANKNGFRNFYN